MGKTSSKKKTGKTKKTAAKKTRLAKKTAPEAAPRRTATRKHRKAIMLNDAELEAIVGFCKKYKITNQAKFFRETIITAILKKTEEDHPKLF
jgi:hypothetical protein